LEMLFLRIVPHDAASGTHGLNSMDGAFLPVLTVDNDDVELAVRVARLLDVPAIDRAMDYRAVDDPRRDSITPMCIVFDGDDLGHPSAVPNCGRTATVLEYAEILLQPRLDEPDEAVRIPGDRVANAIHRASEAKRPQPPGGPQQTLRMKPQTSGSANNRTQKPNVNAMNTVVECSRPM